MTVEKSEGQPERLANPTAFELERAIDELKVLYPDTDTPDPPDEAAPTNNYFLRHWRGEFALPVAFWLNGVLLLFFSELLRFALIFLYLYFSATATPESAESFVVTFYFFHITGPGTPPAGFKSLLMLLQSSQFAAVVWQFVGIWRSATRYSRSGGPRYWAILCKACAILAALVIFFG